MPRYVIDDALVANLLRTQAPQFADLEIGRYYRGGDATAVRLGDKFGAYLPTADGPAGNYQATAAWLPTLASSWTFGVNTPVFLGEPTDAYPYHWLVVEWIEGSTAANVPLDSGEGSALAEAVKQVLKPAPADAPVSSSASQTLSALRPEWDKRLARVATLEGPGGARLDAETFEAVFATGEGAPPFLGRVWVNGAIGPLSILSQRGTFAGICNWDELGTGDPAFDLGHACALFAPGDFPVAAAYAGDLGDDVAARTAAFERLAIVRQLDSGNPLLARSAWTAVAPAKP